MLAKEQNRQLVPQLEIGVKLKSEPTAASYSKYRLVACIADVKIRRAPTVSSRPTPAPRSETSERPVLLQAVTEKEEN